MDKTEKTEAELLTMLRAVMKMSPEGVDVWVSSVRTQAEPEDWKFAVDEGVAAPCRNIIAHAEAAFRLRHTLKQE